jgi:hypothetical protein
VPTGCRVSPKVFAKNISQQTDLLASHLEAGAVTAARAAAMGLTIADIVSGCVERRKQRCAAWRMTSFVPPESNKFLQEFRLNCPISVPVTNQRQSEEIYLAPIG